MLRRGKTVAVTPSSDEKKKQEPFGGGLEPTIILEPAGDGTKSWKGPSTRGRQSTASAGDGVITRGRAMSADDAETPRSRRLRQTSTELQAANKRNEELARSEKRLAQELARSEQRSVLERANSVSSAGGTIEKSSSAGERVVESTIDPRDLAATWEDKQLGRDWRASPVSGEFVTSEGANGKVLRAVWKSSIAVAVKEGDWNDMTDEMNLFLDLTHPHVVSCFGILTETRQKLDESGMEVPYASKSIVTERCKVPLDAFLKDHGAWNQDLFGNTLDAGMVDMRKYTILHHVSLGLQKLHDLNVLHRDIKCGNILLDGAPGTCNSCDHSGLWKICDFGEAKVLKTPSLNFNKPERFPRGWSHGLVAAGRFQPITSPSLWEKGARHCEELVPAEEHDTPPSVRPVDETIHRSETNPQRTQSPIPWEAGKPWAPCSHGGFVYLFSEDESDSSPSDCFFDVSDVSSAPIASTDDVFPETLGPFGLSSTEIRPELDFQACSFCIDSTQALVDGVFFDNPQLQKLEELGLFPLTGRISPKHSVTLTEGARRQAMIPSSATSFVYAYQCVKTFTDAQKAALDEAEMAESDDVSFVSLGGFVYLDCNDLAVGVRAIQIHSVASRFGTIDLEEDDNRVTTPVASPELLEGLGIGLETDIYSFGCVMWEVFTRREAWHWMDSNALAIRQRVLVDKKRPRMMPGLSDECACMVRQCLFDRPSSRPTAKQVTEWLDTQRRELQKELAAKKNEIVRGRDYDADGKLVRRLSRSFTGSRHIDSYMIVDHKDPRANECWSSRGRFSLYKSHGNPEGDKVTSKRIFGIAIDQTNGAEGTRDEWEEDAEDAFDEGSPRTTAYPPLESPQPVMMRAVLESEPEPEPELEPEPEPEPEPVDGSPFVEPEPEPRPQLGQQSTDGATPWQVAGLQAVKMLQQHEWVYTDPHRVVVSFGQPGKMGIVFGSCWPFVRRLMPDFKSNSQAERTKEQPIGSLNKENFEPGCRLLAIRFQGNTYPIDRPDAPRMTYEEAVEILKGTSSRSRQQPLELVFEPRHRFGLVFTRKDGHGGWEHTFPEVASVEPVDKATDLPTIFSQHPEIRSGSRLKSINGISTDGLAEGGVFTCEALRLFRMGSVKLEFELSTHVHTSIVEPWMRAGLDAVSMVRRHEDYRKSEGSSGGDEMDLRNKIQDRDAEIAELKAQLRRLMPEGVPPAS